MGSHIYSELLRQRHSDHLLENIHIERILQVAQILSQLLFADAWFRQQEPSHIVRAVIYDFLCNQIADTFLWLSAKKKKKIHHHQFSVDSNEKALLKNFKVLFLQNSYSCKSARFREL